MRNKKFIIVLVMMLLIALTISFLLVRNNDTETLKPGDTDPETGCIITDGGGATCKGAI